MKTISFLIYIIFGIRLDIAFIISIFSCFSANLINKYLQIAKIVFCYFKETMNFKLKFFGFLEKLISFINTNWVINIITKQLISEYCFYFGNIIINWNSKKQITIALFICKSKYIGQTQIAKKAI